MYALHTTIEPVQEPAEDIDATPSRVHQSNTNYNHFNVTYVYVSSHKIRCIDSIALAKYAWSYKFHIFSFPCNFHMRPHTVLSSTVLKNPVTHVDSCSEVCILISSAEYGSVIIRRFLLHLASHLQYPCYNMHNVKLRINAGQTAPCQPQATTTLLRRSVEKNICRARDV